METAKSDSSAEARNSNPLPLFFWQRNLHFCCCGDRFCVPLFCTSSSFGLFLLSLLMKWTLETEEMLLQLYVEVKTVYNNKMKRDTEKYRWIAKKLAEADVDVTWKQVKDKLQAVKKTGNNKLREFVMPLIRRKESTGSAVDDDAVPPNLMRASMCLFSRAVHVCLCGTGSPEEVPPKFLSHATQKRLRYLTCDRAPE